MRTPQKTTAIQHVPRGRFEWVARQQELHASNAHTMDRARVSYRPARDHRAVNLRAACVGNSVAVFAGDTAALVTVSPRSSEN